MKFQKFWTFYISIFNNNNFNKIQISSKKKLIFWKIMFYNLIIIVFVRSDYNRIFLNIIKKLIRYNLVNNG